MKLLAYKIINWKNIKITILQTLQGNRMVRWYLWIRLQTLQILEYEQWNYCFGNCEKYKFTNIIRLKDYKEWLLFDMCQWYYNITNITKKFVKLLIWNIRKLQNYKNYNFHD